MTLQRAATPFRWRAGDERQPWSTPDPPIRHAVAGAMGEYDVTTGAPINANFITGLNWPTTLALSGNTLFVASLGSTTVGEYNAITDAVINASFITGLPGPTELALSGNHLFVKISSAVRSANTTPPPEPRLTPTSSRG